MGIIKMLIRYNVLLVAFPSILFSCDKSTVSIVIGNMNGGIVKINDEPLDYYLARKTGFKNSTNSLFYLRLNRGNYKLKVVTNQNDIIEKTINVGGGELYLGIDLETGRVDYL